MVVVSHLFLFFSEKFQGQVWLVWVTPAPVVRLAAHVSNGWKSPIRPSSGKDTAKTKGVRRETESEGRWRQISGLTNRNHIRLQLGIRLQYKPKSNNYSELTGVNVADIWRERNVWYLGRSRQQVETEYETCSNNEWREVSRGHSTKGGCKRFGKDWTLGDTS